MSGWGREREAAGEQMLTRLEWMVMQAAWQRRDKASRADSARTHKDGVCPDVILLEDFQRQLNLAQGLPVALHLVEHRGREVFYAHVALAVGGAPGVLPRHVDLCSSRRRGGRGESGEEGGGDEGGHMLAACGAEKIE